MSQSKNIPVNFEDNLPWPTNFDPGTDDELEQVAVAQKQVIL